MSEANKRHIVNELPEFDATQYLDTGEAKVAYLRDIIAQGEPVLLIAALTSIGIVLAEARRRIDGICDAH